MAKLKTLLINPRYQADISGVAQGTVGIPMGLAYLAGALQAGGIDVLALDANALGLSVEDTVRMASRSTPEVIGLSATTATVDRCGQISVALRQAGFGGAIVWGGPHPSALPEQTLLENPALTAIALGEVEPHAVPMFEALAGRSALANVPGIVWQSHTGEILTNPQPNPPPINDIPRPARELFPLHRYRSPDGRQAVTIIASRGCSAPCTYCSVPGQFGKRIRRRDPDSVAHEVTTLRDQYGTRWLSFIDDTFTWKTGWVLDLCASLDQASVAKSGIGWQCLTRVDRVSPDLLKRMRASGCRRIEMGIECASPAGLKALKKGIQPQQVIDAFRWAREANMETLAFAMINVPGETQDEIEQTRQLIRAADPDYLQLSYCTPYPGTPLYAKALSHGWLRSQQWSSYRFLRQPVLDNGVLTSQEVVDAHRRLLVDFWARPKTLLRMGRRLLTRRGARLTTARSVLQGLKHIAMH